VLSSLEIVEDTPPDHKDTFLQKSQSINISSRLHQAVSKPSLQSEPFQTLRQYDAIRTNISSHGARVEFTAPTETLTAGELILIQPKNSNIRQIGLVRWTHVTPKLSRILGVQILTDRAFPCAISQVTAASQGEQQNYPGLKFAMDNEEHVILPTLPFTAYSSGKLHLEGSRKNVRLLGCVESTFHVSIYKLETVS